MPDRSDTTIRPVSEFAEMYFGRRDQEAEFEAFIQMHGGNPTCLLYAREAAQMIRYRFRHDASARQRTTVRRIKQ